MMFQLVCLAAIVRMVNTRVCNGFSFAVTKTESRTRVGSGDLHSAKSSGLQRMNWKPQGARDHPTPGSVRQWLFDVVDYQDRNGSQLGRQLQAELFAQ